MNDLRAYPKMNIIGERRNKCGIETGIRSFSFQFLRLEILLFLSSFEKDTLYALRTVFPNLLTNCVTIGIFGLTTLVEISLAQNCSQIVTFSLSLLDQIIFLLNYRVLPRVANLSLLCILRVFTRIIS